MLRISLHVALLVLVCTHVLHAQSPEQREFFETHIRPVLVEKCYKCHNSTDVDEAGLAVDFRAGIRAETEHGTVVVPGDPESSVLMKVIRHEIDDLEMPEDAGKLDDQVIANFEKWIRWGAADPRDTPPTKDELDKATSWETTLENRRQWWSLQPVVRSQPPPIPGVSHPVDRFIQAKLAEHALTPAPPADRRTLIRRLSFVLTGLPPTTQQVADFLEDTRADAYERLVDSMLASERFGERWARHWMDLMRYADSHGSEGDPAIPEIYRYRDYLIRAFNEDVPYDQLVREHIAGDLLEHPRVHPQLGIHESKIGPAHWRLVFHGFAPTDALDEKVRFTDDQINVLSKAFLGLTVSCARCHDHKFDAVSQADYYALFGILASCRPTLRDVNVPEVQHQHRDALAKWKQTIRQQVADQWLAQLDTVRQRLLGSSEAWQNKVRGAEKPNQLLYLLAEFQRQVDGGVSGGEAWEKMRKAWQKDRDEVDHNDRQSHAWRWDFRQQSDYLAWFRDGNGLPAEVSPAGDFRIESEQRVVAAVLPSGVHANTLSTKHRAYLSSPRFQLDEQYKVWLRISGGGQSMTRYAVEHYPRDGTVYPIRDINNERWFWQEYDLTYWQGDYVHLEVNTARDAPLRTRGSERSWFGIREVLVRDARSSPPLANDREFVGPIFDNDDIPEDVQGVAARYISAIGNAITAWKLCEMSDAQALLLHECLLEGVLDNSVEQLPQVASAVARYLALENEIRSPTRVPGISEADVFDQPLFVRGNHRDPANPVPRRFLEVLDPKPFDTQQSGRLELAQALLDPENPLTARVMVNRIWHYVFGQGIVRTPDNFGQLGERPTHPELLDYLAAEFQQDWSIKNMIRVLVTSATFQQGSGTTAEVAQSDPANRWWSHANVRRLDAEAIRDALISVSGRLTDQMYGPGFPANSNTPRRAVYILSRRNSLDQFLETFNTPVPFATTGRRNQTNVPAQSLTMLNAPFVKQTARAWAERVATEPSDVEQRIRTMFETAMGRLPSDPELRSLTSYLNEMLTHADATRERNAKLQLEIDQQNAQLTAIVAPLEQRLLAEKKLHPKAAPVKPIAAWDFRQSLADTMGDLHGTSHGKARVEDGALRLDGGYVSTPPLPARIETKTLVATVQLDNLQQRGGGVVTVQTLDGNTFDSIVFGEQRPGHWLAGSNGFVRTEDLRGAAEESAQNEPVHMALAYDEDGTIRAYRNGKPYGQPIRKTGPQHFAQGQAQLLFGLRHGTGGNGRLLKGRIFAAQFFDRALSAEEIEALATGSPFVSEQEIWDAMSSETQRQVQQLRSQLTAKRAELREPPSVVECWSRLGHALFNLKEFIYIR